MSLSQKNINNINTGVVQKVTNCHSLIPRYDKNLAVWTAPDTNNCQKSFLNYPIRLWRIYARGSAYKLLIFLIFFTINLYSAPLFFFPVTLTQPNGEIVKCFVSGDEYYNWVHDKDNYTILGNKNGYYVYAIKSLDDIVPSDYIVGKVNPAELNLEKGVNKNPKEILNKNNINNNILEKNNKIFTSTTGKINNLAIFIRFSDEGEFGESISKYENIFNGLNEPSLHNYFFESSYGSLSVKTSFLPTTSNNVLSYQDNHPRAFYQPYDSINNKIGYKLQNPNDTWGSDRKEREMQLLSDALESIKLQIPSDLNLDMDGDGFVDNICFIVSGEPTPWSTLLWPHRWFLVDRTIILNNKKAYNFNFHIKSQVDIKTLCHELFHTLGAPDLYHYIRETLTYPCGAWDIMDQGSGQTCAYMKWKYGKWIDQIQELTTPGAYTLNSLQSSQKCAYKVRSPKSDSEYYIIEYRRKYGLFENSLPGTGLLVYRINSKRNGNSNGPPDEVYLYRPLVGILKHDESKNAFFNREIGRYVFNDTSNPKPLLSNGNYGGLSIIVDKPINVNDSTSTISFTLVAPKSTTIIKNLSSNISEFKLDQNYPNPFNPETKIAFTIPVKSYVDIKIFDQLGREIKNLINEIKEPGSYEIKFNGSNFSSGLYFYTLSVNSNNGSQYFLNTKKMVLAK